MRTAVPYFWQVIGIALLLGSCTKSPERIYCEGICECDEEDGDPCTSDDMDECIAEKEKGADEAEKAGCLQEYEDWITCWGEDGFTCDDDKPGDDDAMACYPELNAYQGCMPSE